MTYRLIALDMDGTLIGRNREISMENRRCIEAALAAGKKVILATGRPIHDVTPYAEQLGLELPLVINNGSEIWRTPSLLQARHELDPELVGRLLGLIRGYVGEVDFWAHTVEGTLTPATMPSEWANLHWLQFAVKSGNPALLQDIRKELEAWDQFEISNSHITNLECNAKGISKASGLREVCEMLDIPIAQAIAVGDSLNDIPMIRAAGLGVAMGNAQEPVKQAAKVIAPTHVEDGVAKVILDYLLA